LLVSRAILLGALLIVSDRGSEFLRWDECSSQLSDTQMRSEERRANAGLTGQKKEKRKKKDWMNLFNFLPLFHKHSGPGIHACFPKLASSEMIVIGQGGSNLTANESSEWPNGSLTASLSSHDVRHLLLL
jgi:hypothetical protein